MRNRFASLIFLSLLLAGCGGSGAGSAVTSGSSGSGSSGSGGSGSGGSGSGSSGSTAYNVVNAVIDEGPAALLAANPPQPAANIMYVKVTICAPGSTTTCQTIDHVQVDTGSQGLRILSTVLNSTMASALKPVTVNGASLAECLEFVDGYSWGPVVTADLHIGGSDTATTGESAPGIPVQVIGTSTYAVPSDCSSNAVNPTAENTVVEFGANGIIGIGLFDEDCGSVCAPGTGTAGVEYGDNYFTCTGTVCNEALIPIANQVINPVNALAAVNGITDNNGVIIKLPSVGAAGAATVTGTLVFGISTQSNNTLSPSATILTAANYTGYVSTNITSLGETFSISYLDSGSNFLYFNDSSIPVCGSSTVADGFFCPASTVQLSAMITGVNNQVAAVDNFQIANANTVFSANNSFAAFSNIAAPSGTTPIEEATFDWGLPFFYGRNVYFAMENMDAGGTNGPYYAF